MRLTIRTNLAMRTLMVCATNPEETVRKSEVAELCNASENHLGQVVRLRPTTAWQGQALPAEASFVVDEDFYVTSRELP